MPALCKYALILFFLQTISYFSVSQSFTYPHSEKKYSFVAYDSSYFESFDNNPNLEIFFNKLDKFYFDGDGDITILQLGGSHVQAGVWSWCMRRRFESLCYDTYGDLGLLFPFAAGKTNNPYYYVSKVKGIWKTEKITKITDDIPNHVGISGMVAYTTDSLSEISFSFAERSEIEKRLFNKVTLIHDVSDTCYDIYTNADSLLLNCETDYTNGYSVFYYSKPLDSLRFRFVRKDTIQSPFYVYGILAENTVSDIKFINIGINGASTSSYLKANKLFSQLNVVTPDLAILSIGVNDASGPNFVAERYIANYKMIVDSILKINPNCAILFTTNNDFYNYRGGVNINQPKVYEAMVELAKYYHGSVWNLYRIMGGYKSINTWYIKGLAKKDKIHFTIDGYNLVGNLFFDAFLTEYEKHLKILGNTEIKKE